MTGANLIQRSIAALRVRAPALMAGLLFAAFLALYARTAAPSVLSGDSAEFQLAAPLLGVPHPTTYPLYMLLGKLATLTVPFGDLAWRVTLVSAGCAALAVTLFFVLAWRISASLAAATIGALALGLTPGLWNAATMAEVYALLAALLAGLACALAAGGGKNHRTGDQETRRPGDQEIRSTTFERTARAQPPTPNSQLPTPLLAALIGGLGFTHHGLFVIAGLPLLAGYTLGWLLQRRARDWPRQLALLALCFAAGLLPWLYPIVQYARYGPFSGMDYGLPQHYFWGSPTSWEQVFSLLLGGPLRNGIFRLPSVSDSTAVVQMVGARLWFEFGPLGLALGLLGCVTLLRRARIVWIGAAWMFCATLAYLLLLGPAVQDAPVFTLPMLLPWALWIASGVAFLCSLARGMVSRRRPTTDDRRPTIPHPLSITAPCAALVPHFALVALLLLATLAWGYTRIPYANKRHLTLFRTFGEATLAQLPPHAAVITHWEQGMTLQYLVLAERRRPDVWIDLVEPSDVAWGTRAERYADRPVFFVGAPADVAGLPADQVRADDYADLFVLRK